MPCRSSRPVFQSQAGDTTELLRVVGDQESVVRPCGRGDHQVIGTDRSAFVPLGPRESGHSAPRNGRRTEDSEAAKKRFEAFEDWRLLSRYGVHRKTVPP